MTALNLRWRDMLGNGKIIGAVRPDDKRKLESSGVWQNLMAMEREGLIGNMTLHREPVRLTTVAYFDVTTKGLLYRSILTIKRK